MTRTLEEYGVLRHQEWTDRRDENLRLSTVQRFEPEIYREDRIRMDLDSRGDWVKFSDMEKSIGLLRNLVTALDKAYISSWQSTHNWQKELDLAREYLETGNNEVAS